MSKEPPHIQKPEQCSPRRGQASSNSAGTASPRSTAGLRPDGKDAAPEAPRQPELTAGSRLCLQSRLVRGRKGCTRARTRPVRHRDSRSSRHFLSTSSVPGTGTHCPSKSSLSVKPGGPAHPSLQDFPDLGASQVALVVESPPAMQETQETWVRSLGREDPLEEEMATHSSSLAWRIPRTEEPGGLQSVGSQRVGHDLDLKLLRSTSWDPRTPRQTRAVAPCMSGTQTACPPGASGHQLSWFWQCCEVRLCCCYCYPHPEEEAEPSRRLLPVTQQGCGEARATPCSPDPRHWALSYMPCLEILCGAKPAKGCGNRGGRAAGLCPSAEQRAGGVCLLLRRVSALGACYTWHLSIRHDLGSWDPTGGVLV